MSTALSYDRPSSPAREDGEVDMDLNQDTSNYETSNQGYGDDSQQRTRSTNIPKEVDPDREDGTEDEKEEDKRNEQEQKGDFDISLLLEAIPDTSDI